LTETVFLSTLVKTSSISAILLKHQELERTKFSFMFVKLDHDLFWGHVVASVGAMIKQ